MSEDAKAGIAIAVFLAITFIMCGYFMYLGNIDNQETARTCIEAGKMWHLGSCFPK